MLNHDARRLSHSGRFFEPLEGRSMLDGLAYDPAHATLLNGQPAQIPAVTDDFLNAESDPASAAGNSADGDAGMYDLPDLGGNWWSGNFAHMPRSDGGAQFDDSLGRIDWAAEAAADAEAAPAQLVGVNDTVWPDDAGPADQLTPGSDPADRPDVAPQGGAASSPLFVAPQPAAAAFLTIQAPGRAPSAPSAISLFNYTASDSAAGLPATFLRS